MTTRERILLSMCGAIMPIFVNLYFMDFSKISSVSFDWISYIAKLMVLLSVGALIGYLHQTETNKMKMFQLGLAVPSLIAAFYSGKALEDSAKKFSEELKSHTNTEVRVPDNSFNFLFNLFPAAYAQLPDSALEKYHKPEQSIAKSIWQGISGNEPENIWYVIAFSSATERDAVAEAERINGLGLGFTAHVYEPYRGNPNYAVVIGANLHLTEAKELRGKAILAGLPKDTFLWSLK